MNEHLTRREALVAALAATALGGQALARPRAARAAASTSIGVILPLSRPGDSTAGNNILRCAHLWADWVNGRGGVDGQHVVIKQYDSKADPDRAARNVARAVTKDGCAVILGGWDSNVALAEIQLAHQYQVPMFVAYAWSPDITKANYPEVVRIGPNNDMLSSAFAPFMLKRKYRRVAVIAEDTAFGRGLGEAIRATATLAGIDMTEQNYPRDTHDVRPTLKKVLPAKPDAIVIASVLAPGLYLAVTQARAAGYKGDIVLGWDYVDSAFWKATGKRGVGVIWPTFSAPTLHFTSAGLTFKHLFTKKYKQAPLVYQAFTWDQLSAWKWAAETAGSAAPADVIPVLPRIDMQGTMGRITLSIEPGTVHYNQWEGVTVYFDQATKKGATDSTAKVIASIEGHSS
ncbi:MAG: branched-chain amino acid transport system substrate-binding protein [Gaiellales bacterium]|nr:branched-chain amino acid transport system substrate-binding protein [Gaiellales bacterium]